ncbi:MAG: VanZ family protein [Verrucomicrobiota bacterium]|nr:VanZ family protein [Verrucomicrobiota bacterium]
MLVISLFSTDHFSSQQTSRIIGPLMRFLIPGVEDSTIAGVQFLIRKSGHFSEYAILCLLMYRALNRKYARPIAVWSMGAAWWTLTGCVIFAGLDEWHQTLTHHRMGSGMDVTLDGMGTSAALIWIYWRSKR